MKCWWFEIFMLWNSFYVLTSRTSFLALIEPEDSSLSSCFQESAFWVCSCRLTREYSIGSRLVFRISFLVLIGTSPCSYSAFPGLMGSLKSCGGLFLALNGLSNTRFMGLDFAIAGFMGFGFLPSVNLQRMSLLVLSLTWHSASWSDQKENYWNGRKRTSRKSCCWTNEEDDSAHAWNLLRSACQRFEFWCQHIWCGFLDLNWFCQTTNLTQLCGFWTRVSLFDFVLWWPTWWKLRRLQKCATRTHLEKSVCLWVRCPHLTIDQHLGCSFLRLFPETKLVGVLFLVLLREWSPVPHQFPGTHLIGL